MYSSQNNKNNQSVEPQPNRTRSRTIPMSVRKRRSAFGPMWVSHNKVLIGSGGYGTKKPHGRNPNFDSEETKLLIQLWGDPQVQRTLITTHKKHPVISKIADKMRGFGYTRSTEEINTRIKNLKCLYNRIKKDLEAGHLNEPTWKHYAAMDEILSRPVFGNSNKIPQPHLVNQQTKIEPESTTDNTNANEIKTMEPDSVTIKEEKESDDEMADAEEISNDLRPEDLLRVEEANHVEMMVKEEPVDLDDNKDDLDSDEDDEESSEEDTSTPTKTVNLTTTNNNNIINYATDSNLSITSVVSNAKGNHVINSMPGTMKAITSQNNKISLVPTKLLLKASQPQTKTYNSPTLVYSSAGNQTAVSTTNSSSIPMKVVFVNALNKNANCSNNVNNTISKTTLGNLTTIQSQQIQQISPTIPKIQQVQQLQVPKIQGIQQHQIQQITQILNNSSHDDTNNIKTIPNSFPGIAKPKETVIRDKSTLPVKYPSIKNMMSSLIAIQKQRLEVDKERLKFEKSIGNEILQMMRAFIAPKTKNQNSDDDSEQAQN